MPCNPSSIRLNSLESIWYCNLAVMLTAFLVFDGHRRYLNYVSLPWPEDEQPIPELRLYLFMIVVAVILITAFIPSQYFKVGNHANDQSKLGAKSKRKKPKETNQAKSKENPVNSVQSLSDIVRFVLQAIQSCRKHLGPIGATIHITSAFCLLLPVVFLQARAIHAGLFPPDMIWRSEVGEMYMLQNPENISVVQIITVVSPSSNDEQYLPTDHTTSPTPSYPISYIDSFSTVGVTINYLNYVVPLFLYAIRYADVFWECHKGFALLISIQLMMNAFQYALGFIGMSLLYKLHWYGWEKYDIDRRPVFSSGPALIPAYLINNITVFVAAAILYLYGYGRLKRIERKRTNTVDSVEPETLIALKYRGLLPQIAAMCALLIFISCKTPFMIEYMAVYRFSGDGRMLCCIVFDSLYIIVWFALWIFLSVKRHWEFTHTLPDEISGMYDKDMATNNSAERLEPLLLAGTANIDNEITTSSKGSLEFELRDRKDRPFSNGSLQMIYVRNGESTDKYVRVNGVGTGDGRDVRPHPESRVILEGQENVTLDTDVNILSNPLSSS